MHSFKVRFFFILGVCAVLLLPTAARANDGWSERVLYSFAGRADGAYPTASLIADAGGNLYGTTPGGGIGFGTVFTLLPPATGSVGWTYRVLYSFRGGADGAYPSSGVIADRAGALYATTGAGGAFGGGTVFKLTPPAAAGSAWTESVLASFPTVSDYGAQFPSQPQGLIADANGALYGSTLLGGSAANCDYYYDLTACGSVFKLTPPTAGRSGWTQSQLYSFANSSFAAFPSIVSAGLGGALYGLTAYGAGNAGDAVHCNADYHGEGCGTIFALTPAAGGGAASLNVLHAFSGYAAVPNDGIIPFSPPQITAPAGLVVDRTGALYGTTPYGGGTCGVNGCSGFCPHEGCGAVFELAPPAAGQSAWNERILHRFSGGGDGKTPLGPLLADRFGALYGTTSAGGALACACGTVFRLLANATTPTISTLYTFGGNDGATPTAGLLQVGRVLYGTTTNGGASNHGTIFALSQHCGRWCTRVNRADPRLPRMPQP